MYMLQRLIRPYLPTPMSNEDPPQPSLSRSGSCSILLYLLFSNHLQPLSSSSAITPATTLPPLLDTPYTTKTSIFIQIWSIFIFWGKFLKYHLFEIDLTYLMCIVCLFSSIRFNFKLCMCKLLFKDALVSRFVLLNCKSESLNTLLNREFVWVYTRCLKIFHQNQVYF